MLKLGVNIDHVATLRQARYKMAAGSDDMGTSAAVAEPDPMWAIVETEMAGAHAITMHLREDRRHIQERDVRVARQIMRTRLNLEMADVPQIVAFAEEIRPDEVCIVPENRQEVTTEGGLNVARAGQTLSRTITRLKKSGIPVSLFVDPDLDQVRAAADAGADFIELHTGGYACCGGESARTAAIEKLAEAARLANNLGLRVNAGHGLNYENTPGILAVPHLETLNTGHSIISRAVFVGLRQAVREMLALMSPYRG